MMDFEDFAFKVICLLFIVIILILNTSVFWATAKWLGWSETSILCSILLAYALGVGFCIALILLWRREKC